MADVSVIIPTWNRENTIGKAVQSALGQTLSPLEVLICDDGSTDNTFTVIKSFNDPRVRWIAGLRGGRPAIPRNRGIRESKGDWLAFLDSDDEWLPDKLEKQLAVAEKTGCFAVCSNALRYVPGKGKEGNFFTDQLSRVTFNDLLKLNRIICSSSLVHKSLLSKTGGFPEGAHLKALEDYALWLRIAVFTDFAYMAEPQLIYREDAANSVRNSITDTRRQRSIVFSDFRHWAEHVESGAHFIGLMKRQIVKDGFNNILRQILSIIRKP